MLLPVVAVTTAGWELEVVMVEEATAAMAALVDLVALVGAKSLSIMFVFSDALLICLVLVDSSSQLPYTVGWQDLKDLFRQAGK